MNIDRAIRNSPYFTPRNAIIASLMVALVVALYVLGTHVHYRATVCDRATADGSLWAQGPKAQAGRQACSRFREAWMIPCTIASQNQTAFCAQSTHGHDNGDFPDQARTVSSHTAPSAASTGSCC